MKDLAQTFMPDPSQTSRKKVKQLSSILATLVTRLRLPGLNFHKVIVLQLQ